MLRARVSVANRARLQLCEGATPSYGKSFQSCDFVFCTSIVYVRALAVTKCRIAGTNHKNEPLHTS